jgi:hypothetical protein
MGESCVAGSFRHAVLDFRLPKTLMMKFPRATDLMATPMPVEIRSFPFALGARDVALVRR